MLRVREKKKINVNQKRFTIMPCDDNDGCVTIVDCDAEPVWTIEKKGRHVCRVVREYTKPLLDLMNFDEGEFLGLLPHKGKDKRSMLVNKRKIKD